MNRIFHIIFLLASIMAGNRLFAQCSVFITTNTKTNILNCTDTAILLTAEVEGTKPVKYLWSTKDSTAFIAVKAPGTYEVTITATGGCTTKSRITISQDTTPPAVSIRAFPEKICAGDSVTLVALGAQSYVWDWDFPLNPTSDVVVVKPDKTSDYAVTGTGANGCTTKVSKTIEVNETFLAAGIYNSNFGITSVCQYSNDAFIIMGGVNGSAPYTFGYTINNGPAQTIQTLGRENSVTFRVPTDTLGTFTYNLLSVSDSNNCKGRFTINPNQAVIAVLPVPKLVSKKDTTICNQVMFEYTAVVSPPATTISWRRDSVPGISNKAQNDTLTANIKETLQNTTQDPLVVTYIFTLSTGPGCIIIDSLRVTVNPTPVIKKVSNKTYCNNEFVSNGIPLVSQPSGGVITWINSNPGIGLPANGTGDLPAFIAKNTGKRADSAEIKVFVEASPEGCAGKDSLVFKIRVLPTPALTNAVKTSSLCDSTLFDYNFTSDTEGATFKWVRPRVAGIVNHPDSADSPLIREWLDNSTNLPVTVKYYIYLRVGSACTTLDSIEVTVNPTPTIETLSNRSYCNGQFVAGGIPFSSPSPNAYFSWRTNNPSIGLDSTRGTGNIPAFIATNSGSNTAVAQITVFVQASVDSCSAKDSVVFTISVLPAPVLSNPIKTNSICDSTLFEFRATSATTGTDFKWTRPFITGISNPARSDNSPVIKEWLDNTTQNPITVEYIFTLTTPGISCITTEVVRVTVNPTPIINQLANQTYCNGFYVNGGIPFSSKAPNASFSWTNNNTTIGLGASGFGNILPFNASNTSANSVVANIVVSVKAGSDNCPGADSSFSIAILPALKLTSPKDLKICNKGVFAYQPASSANNTIIEWKRIDTNVILPAAHPGFQKTNPNGFLSEQLENKSEQSVRVIYVFRLTLPGGGCESYDTIHLTVFPTAVINPITTFSYCNRSLTNSIVFSSNTSGAVFSWNNNNNKIGLPLSGSGNIAPFISINDTTIEQSSTVTVSVFTDNGNCPGEDRTFSIFVLPTPTLSSPLAKSVCDSNLFSYTATSFTPGVRISWKRVKVPGVQNETNDSPSGSINEYLDNTTNRPVNVRYNFTLTTGNNCSSTEALLVAVNPTPVIDNRGDTLFCDNENVKIIKLSSPTENHEITWDNNNKEIGLAASGIGSIPAFTTSNRDTTRIRATITVNISASSDNCRGKPESFVIAVNPPVPRPNFRSAGGIIQQDSLILCQGSENINFNVNAPARGIEYRWDFVGNPLLVGRIKDVNSPNTVISFPVSSTGFVRVTATDTVNGSCFLRVFQPVRVRSVPGIEERKIFLKSPGNVLVYPDNSMDSYQWGTDRILSVSPDSSFGPPVKIPNQVYQFFPAGNTLDVSQYLYWVLLDSGGCQSRVYFNGPYAGNQSRVVYTSNPVELQVFPNPNQGNFDVSLKGNLYGNIQAKIYNAAGQQVYTKRFVKSAPEILEKFNTGKLSSGIYFLELYSSDLKKVVTRFIIQH